MSEACQVIAPDVSNSNPAEEDWPTQANVAETQRHQIGGQDVPKPGEAHQSQVAPVHRQVHASAREALEWPIYWPKSDHSAFCLCRFPHMKAWRLAFTKQVTPCGLASLRLSVYIEQLLKLRFLSQAFGQGFCERVGLALVGSQSCMYQLPYSAVRQLL